MLTIQDILATLPHRPPMLLLDRVLEIEEGSRVVGEKLVTINEPFFQGHFPAYPVMPGVLIIEAIAQLGAVGLLRQPEHQGKLPMFAGIDEARFRRQVVPGDTLRLEITLDKIRRGIGRASGSASVDGQPACEARLLFALVDPPA